MNLLVDAHVFNETHQGSRTYIKGLYSELVKMMQDVTFFFAAYDVDKLRQEFSEGPNVRFIQLTQKKYLRLLAEFPLIIKKYKIDYAHFQYISPPIKNCKHIVTTHDILFKDFKHLFPLKYRAIKDFLFRVSAVRADILLTVSEYSKTSLSKHYRISPESIHVTPNGISADFLRETEGDFSGLRKKYGVDKYLLFVSRVEPRKNHMQLLRAFYELKLWKDYQLIFIGKKDFLYDSLDHFLKGGPSDFQTRVLFLENVETQELVSFYKNASLFVYPSLAEGFGIPPIEAISMGVTTLCSSATAMGDFTFLGNNLFDPNDIEELKNKIMDSLQHPQTADRKNELKELVKKKYAWAESAKTFKYFLKKVSDNADNVNS